MFFRFPSFCLIAERYDRCLSGTGLRSCSLLGSWHLLLHLLLLALLIPPGLHGQPRSAPAQVDTRYTLQQWTIADGLPVNTVYDLAHGPEGFLWLATHDGLVRFDGFQFRIFTVSTTPALPSNRIRRVWTSPQGALWIQTEAFALIRYQEQTFTRIDTTHGLPVGHKKWFADASANSLLVRTPQGVHRYEASIDRFVPVAPAIVRSTARAVHRAANGTLWIGMDSGETVGLRRTSSGGWTQVARIRPEQLPHSAPVRALWVDPSTETLWMASESHMMRYDGKTVYTTTQAGLPLPRVDSPEEMLRLEGIPRHFFPDPDGGLRFSTDLRTFRITPTEAMRVAEAPAQWRIATDACDWREMNGDVWCGRTRVVQSSFDMLHALPDASGALWVGTYSGGLLRIRSSRFRTYSAEDGLAGPNVYGLHETRDGTLWIASTSGLSRLHPDGRIDTVSNERLPIENVRTVLQERDGTLWAATIDGVCRWRDERCEPAAALPPSAASRALYQDREGALWIAYEGGIARRAPLGVASMPDSSSDKSPDARPTPAPEARAAEARAAETQAAEETWTHFDATDGLPPGSTIQRITETRDGALWIATTAHGIARFNGTRFERLTTADGLPIDNVREIYQDESDALWLGTEGAGLVRLTIDVQPLRIRSLQQVRARDGLPDNTIHRIMPDDHGRLWMSSNEGIFWVRMNDLTRFANGHRDHARVPVMRYDTHDGMRNREANGGVQHAGIRSRTGRLWFPTQDGIAGIHPDDEPTTRPAPHPVIEDVIANRRVLAPEADGTLRIEPHQRTFSIRYTAPALNNPDDVVYRYRLQGLDDAWNNRQDVREAFYTRLSPGHYRFEVVTQRETAPDRMAALPIYVVPRFYERTLFWILLSLLGVLGTVASVQYRIVRGERRADELERMIEARTSELARAKEKAETASELKSRFLAHVTHDLRSPLTGIIGFAEVLQDELDGQHKRFARLIEESARQSGAMVESLLQLARLQSDTDPIETEALDLRKGIGSALDTLHHRATQRGICLETHLPDRPIAAQANQRAVERIVLNIVGNAIKYAASGDRVTIRLSAPEDTKEAAPASEPVVLTVVDTGPGIDPDFLPYLFEPFARGTSTEDGSGLGMAITREFVLKMNGTIDVDSTLGDGTTVTVSLPAASCASLSSGAADDEDEGETKQGRQQEEHTSQA